MKMIIAGNVRAAAVSMKQTAVNPMEALNFLPGGFAVKKTNAAIIQIAVFAGSR